MSSESQLRKLPGERDNYIAQYYGQGLLAKMHAWIFKSRLQKLSIGLEAMGKVPKLTLDVGCGPMFSSQELLAINRKGAYVGVDMISTSELKKYRNALREVTGGDIEAIRASGELLPFRDTIFDVIVSLDVLEHVDYPTKCAIEIDRTGYPGGVVVISLPTENYFQKLLRLGFFLMKFTNDPNVERTETKTMLSWITKMPSYHYRGNIKSYWEMELMLKEHFYVINKQYTPLGCHKALNINTILFLVNTNLKNMLK